MADSNLISNRFERLEEIGAGAMGTVYLGRDTFDDSKVAIKELKPEVVKEDPELVERFTREGEALRKLNHPSIVQVLASVDENDSHYIVMEHVDGGSLEDLLKDKGQLPINQVLEIALDLSDALARAHRLNIIHRDIKPANVLIASDGTPRLTDFGIAKIGDTSRMTQTGVIMGTLAYLPPEALSGIRIDHRADIWAFGVMLYEMCSGLRPFQSETTGGLLSSILYGSVPDLLQHRPYEDFGSWGLPGLIYWMLEKEREDRPNSARLVGAMVENLLSGTELPNWNLFGDKTGIYDGSKEYESSTNIQLSPEQAAKAARELTTSGFRLENLQKEMTDSQVSISVPDEDWRADPTISRDDWSISIKRKLGHKPRIFISYRRQDSIALTGRIYDRLVMAFGHENVFRDLDDIPAGVDFKKLLEERIAGCDVALIMIGPKWLNAANETGRRLEDESDFVRIEVAAALGMRDKLVIPVLLEGAEMPEERLLPSNMKSLIFRNAAPVRHDPDFNRDAEWLINQIHNAFEYEAPKRKIGWQTYAIAASAVLIIILAAALVYSFATGGGFGTQANVLPDSCNVALVGEDETMVLIAQPERISGEERDVQEFIFEDLRELFEVTAPFSKVRIRASDTFVTDEETALALADLCNAGVIIWGRYDEDRSFMNVELGDVEDFRPLVFDESDLRVTSDADYILEDELTETLAYGVVAVLNATATASNDGLSVAVSLSVANEISDTPAKVQGNSAAARYHRQASMYISDPERGIEELNDTINLTGGNPMVYMYRALLYQRIGNLTKAREDTKIAGEFGPENWIIPQFMTVNDLVYFQQDYAASIPLLDEIVPITPDDWFLRNYRGNMYYLVADYESARPDLEYAVSHNPIANWPYAGSIGLALRDADFLRAQELFLESKTNFRNPAELSRILTITFNEDTLQTSFVPFTSGFTNLTLELWSSVIKDMDEAIALGLEMPDVYFMRGYASCNLGDYESAEESYTNAIEMAPDFTFMYLLRAEVRFRQGGLKLAGAAQDLAAIVSSEQADLYEPLTSQGVDLLDELGCENFLEVDLSEFGITKESD